MEVVPARLARAFGTWRCASRVSRVSFVSFSSLAAVYYETATMPRVLDTNDDLPIRTDKPVHSGKVRAVYWLTAADSARLIKARKYDVAPDAELAIMVISDRISAYECIWRASGDLKGVPGKGAALNAISNHWFSLFREKGLADSHILEVPHPLVWVVQRAAPVMIEAIIRQYITGSMWRDYVKGSRDFCGIALPDGLGKDSKLAELLLTPSTKGVLKGIDGVPEVDDVNVSRATIAANHAAFCFESADDIAVYEKLLTEGFGVISDALAEQVALFLREQSDNVVVVTQYQKHVLPEQSHALPLGVYHRHCARSVGQHDGVRRCESSVPEAWL